MQIEVNKMITLGNDQKYIVIDKVKRNNRNYSKNFRIIGYQN